MGFKSKVQPVFQSAERYLTMRAYVFWHYPFRELYDKSILALVSFSVILQLLSLPVLALAKRQPDVAISE